MENTMNEATTENYICGNVRDMDVKDIWNILTKSGTTNSINSAGAYASYSRNNEVIEFKTDLLNYVIETSKTFCKDIAEKAMKYNLSEKQAWCVAFELKKIVK